MYNLLKWLHILAAAVALGSNLTYPVWLRQAAESNEKTRFALQGIGLIDRRLANSGYALLLLTGIGMVLAGGIAWNTPWLELSLGLYALVFLIAMLIYSPALRKQTELATSAGADSAEYQAAAERASLWGYVIMLIVVGIIYVMSAKPTLWG